MAATDKDEFKDRFLEQVVRKHGLVVSGRALYSVLGFPSAEALRQAKHRGLLPVPLFKLPARRGYFALSCDIADWLCEQRFRACTKEGDYELAVIEI